MLLCPRLSCFIYLQSIDLWSVFRSLHGKICLGFTALHGPCLCVYSELLLQDLVNAFQQEAQTSRKACLLLSSAIPAGWPYKEAGYEWGGQNCSVSLRQMAWTLCSLQGRETKGKLSLPQSGDSPVPPADPERICLLYLLLHPSGVPVFGALDLPLRIQSWNTPGRGKREALSISRRMSCLAPSHPKPIESEPLP